jgi:hypothetical protein
MGSTEEGWTVKVTHKSKSKSNGAPPAVAPPSAVSENPVPKSEDEQRLDVVNEEIAKLAAQRIELEAQLARIQKQLAELSVCQANYADEKTLLERRIERQQTLEAIKNSTVNPKSGCPPAPASRPDSHEFPPLSDVGQSANKGGNFLMALNSSAPALPRLPAAPVETPTPEFQPGTVSFKILLKTLAEQTSETVENPTLGEGHAFSFHFPCVSLTPDATKFVKTLAAREFTQGQLIQHCMDAREVLLTTTTPIKCNMKVFSFIRLLAKDFTHTYEFHDTFKVTMEVYFTPPQKK